MKVRLQLLEVGRVVVALQTQRRRNHLGQCGGRDAEKMAKHVPERAIVALRQLVQLRRHAQKQRLAAQHVQLLPVEPQVVLHVGKGQPALAVHARHRLRKGHVLSRARPARGLLLGQHAGEEGHPVGCVNSVGSVKSQVKSRRFIGSSLAPYFSPTCSPRARKSAFTTCRLDPTPGSTISIDSRPRQRASNRPALLFC